MTHPAALPRARVSLVFASHTWRVPLVASQLRSHNRLSLSDLARAHTLPLAADLPFASRRS
jgi:hypothetical protein